MPLTPAPLEVFAASPLGRFFAGPTFAHFCSSADLWGVVLWGRPQSEEVASLVRSLRLELEDTAAPHGSIVDARRLEGADVSAFAVLDAYVREHQDALSSKVTRLALLRPEGMTGAVVAGFFEVLPRPYPVEVFAAPDQALAWLALSSPPDPGLLDAIHGAATGAAPIVTALRALLDNRLTDISIADASRHLGVSERTLQRRLRGAGTSFLDQLNQARMRAAQRLLLDSDEPVTSIALEVGCATPQHFSTLFRKHTGVTPSAWRRAQRSAEVEPKS